MTADDRSHVHPLNSLNQNNSRGAKKTTEIYTHVSNRDIGKIKSPLDSLQIKGGEDDD